MRRRLLRLAAVAALAAGGAAALRSFEHRARTVHLRYEAPAGPLDVRLLAPDGRLLRRTSFSAGAERLHDADLPPGECQVELELAGERRTRTLFVGDETESAIVDWRR